MPDTLTEYQAKAERLREIMPWATDDLIGVVLATCGQPCITVTRGSAGGYETAIEYASR